MYAIRMVLIMPIFVNNNNYYKYTQIFADHNAVISGNKNQRDKQLTCLSIMCTS